MDKYLLQYCKDNDFPVNEMNEDDFKTIDKSFGYNAYTLSKTVKEMIYYILKDVFKIERLLK